jgi:hypothetical protein
MVERYGLKRLPMVKGQYLYLLYQQEIIVKNNIRFLIIKAKDKSVAGGRRLVT